MDNQKGISLQAMQSATDVKCESCGGAFFVPVFIIKHISALMMPNGQETNVPIQTFGCSKCGHVNAEFVPSL